MSENYLFANKENVLRAFRKIFMQQFKGDPVSNPNLEVDVIDAGQVVSSAGVQHAVVLITPWTINGLLLPGIGLPEQIQIAANLRPVFTLSNPDCGEYAQVALVPDVSAYTSQKQAHTIANSFVPVFIDAVRKAVQQGN